MKDLWNQIIKNLNSNIEIHKFAKVRDEVRDFLHLNSNIEIHKSKEKALDFARKIPFKF